MLTSYKKMEWCNCENIRNRKTNTEEVSIQNILKEFRLLTNDLEHLLYPSLLESEGEESSNEKFEEDSK